MNIVQKFLLDNGTHFRNNNFVGKYGNLSPKFL